jgi:signal transduction histidine kinase
MLIIGIGTAVSISSAVVRGYESMAVQMRTAIVKNQCIMLANQLASVDYLNNPTNAIVNARIDMITSIYGGRILIVDEDYKIIKDTFDLDKGKYMLSSIVIDCFGGTEYSHYDADNDIVEMAVTITSTEEPESEVIGVMLTSFSTKEIANIRKTLERNETLVLGVSIFVIVAVGLWASWLLVRPFKKITSAIDAMEIEPISVYDYYETQQITDAFNRLIDKVNTMEESRQEFVSNVSHELKTPLASIKVLADSLMMNPDADIEQYKEFMKDISEEVTRENAIISDLLSLVSMDKNIEGLNIQKVNINDLIDLVVKRLKPIADLANVELIVESFKNVEAEVDETKLTQIITNITENAIKYNKPEGGWVRITLNADHQYMYLTISDSGIGIPKEAQERIFDRFYRVDKSHSREIGGTGLGLAITKSAINMHKGAIRVSSVENEGTTFSIRIPLIHIA